MVLNKKVILALSLQSFILLQLYVPQAASQRCSKKSEIVFVVDQSGSITDANPRNGSWNNWSLIKDFISQIIRNTEIGYNGVHVGLVTFGNIGVTRFRLRDYLDANSLIEAVREIPPGNGQTNLYAGLNLACTDVLNVVNNARPDVPQIIIVITDGKANINTEMTIPQAQACQASGVRIFAVGVTQSIDEEQLKQVSSPPHTLGSNYWTTPDFTSLASIVASVQQATCDPPKEIFDGCRTMDICFAIDVPQTMSDYVKVKNFINRFITLYLQIGVNAVRVCIITFDNRQATLQIPLNKYYDEDSFKIALDELPFVPSNYGDPAYALQLASNTAFSALNGARGSNFKPTLITMLNNGIQNRATVIDAFNTLYNRGIRSIGIGMTSDISESEVQLLTYIGTDVLSSIGYDYLSTQVQYLSYILCRNSSYVLCPIAAEICLALDQSTSILAAPGGYDNWKVHILGFAKSLAGAFPIGPTDTRVSVVQFSTGAGVSFQLYQHTTRSDLINAIDKLEAAGGDTNIAGALRACRSDAFRYARPSVPLIVLLVTDGKANIDATRTMVEANATKALGANVFTIGITSNVDVNQLRQIASFPPETHYFFASDFSKLRSIVIDVLQKSCNVPGTGSTIRVGSSTTSISSSRSSLLSSTTSRPIQSQTSTSRQPTTTSTGTSCQSGLDLVLILDESTSIVYAPGNYDNWYKYILGFSTDILDAFDIGPTKTQVGVIKFSENAYASIYLNDYKDKTSLKRAVQSLDIRGGETNIAAAFRVTRTLLYSSSHGARPNVARVAILLTDGAPNRERNFTQSEADLLKALGVRLFTVGVTDMTNTAELKRLCSQPSDTYFYYVNDYSQLSTIVKRVLATTCNDVVPIVQTTTSPPRSATVATTKPPSSTVRSGASTTASVAKGCEAVGDIVLLLDESTSIVFSESGYNSWYVNILGFLKEICRSFHISTTATRFAVVKFSGSYTISMRLNAYDTIDKLTHAIDQLDINGGETNLALPLRIARTVVLPEGRSNAKKVIVLLTDGVANREVNMTTKEADLCKQDGIEIFTVGVSSMISPLQLQTIASTPVSTHYYYAAKFDQLQNIVGMLSRSICQSVQRVP